MRVAPDGKSVFRCALTVHLETVEIPSQGWMEAADDAQRAGVVSHETKATFLQQAESCSALLKKSLSCWERLNGSISSRSRSPINQ